MASKYWLGNAAAVAQVDTYTPGGTITTGDVNHLLFTAQDGSTQDITFTTGATTTAAAVSAGLIAAWNTNPITAAAAGASGSATVILTAKTSGAPFSVTSSVTGTGTLTRAATTASSGPSDWAIAANWSDGAVPATGDSVTLDGRGGAGVLYSLGQSAVTLANLNIDRAFIFAVGTTALALKISATAWRIGQAPSDGSSPSGSTLINLDFGSNQFTGRMIGSNNTGTSGLPTVNIAGTHASNAINMSGGVLGVATAKPAQASTIASASISGGKLTVGSNVTWTTLTNSGGTLAVNGGSSSGTITNYSGTLITEGTALIGAIAGYGGTIQPNHRVSASASLTNFNALGAAWDFSGNEAAITMTDTTLRSGSIRTASPSQITFGTITFDPNGRTQISMS